MSDPKQVHIQGDMTLSVGLDSSLGDGFLNIESATGGLDVQGATTLDQTTIDTTDAQFLVNGSNKINFAPTSSIEMQAAGTSFFRTSVGSLTAQAQAGALSLTGNSATLVSDTTTVGITGETGVTVASIANNVTVNASSNFDVNATAAITMDANAASNLSVTGSGNLTLETSAGRAIVTGGSSSVNAVTIAASNAAGGIDIDCGTGGFDVLATDGKFSIDAQNVASNISLATNADAQDFVIALTGTSNSSILMSSTGTGTDAIKITASDTTGGIDLDAGTNGIVADTTGTISLDSQAASNFTVTGAFDLTASSTLGSVIIDGGEAAVDAVTINASNVAGGLDINVGSGGITADTTAGFSIDGATASNITVTGTQGLTVNNTAGKLTVQSGQAAADALVIYASNGAGGIDMDSGTAGIDILSQGLVSIDANGAASNFSLATSGAAQDLTVSVTGATDSSLYLTSTGTNSLDAIVINASAGGVDFDALGEIHIDSQNTANGVFIATATAGVPVTIGTATSVTTISGNLTVSGTTTTVNTETLLVEDNLIVMNSGGGELGNDGGMVIRRFQTPNNAPSGDVIGDTGAGIISSTLQTGSTLAPDTLVLNASASAVNDFYNGMWIQITSGTQINKVRRIKDYVGATKVATLYMTADNVTGFTDGLDLGGTASLVGDGYSIFNSPYIGSFYDESSDKWTLAFTNVAPDAISDPGPSTVTIQRYAAFDSGSITIQDNGTPGNSTLNVNTINEFTSDIGVTIEGVNINNGLIGGSAPDTTQIIELFDDETLSGAVAVATATIGAYVVFVDAVQAASGAGSFLRQTGGAFSVFAVASSGIGGAVNRLAGSKGTDNQRIDATWTTGQSLKIHHKPGFTGGTHVLKPYRVKIQKVV
jgi:hypothetical protein